MKAELITLHTVYNYGSVLQAYATQNIFKKHGVDVEIINFIRENNLFFKKLKSESGGSIIKSLVLLPTLLKQKKVFNDFCNKNLNISDKKYINESDFNNYKLDSDLYITGSDQVWNSDWNNGVIKPLYLSFVKNKPKFAFSSSFGKEKIDKKEVDETIDLIYNYDYITVRENTGVKILKEQYNYEKCEQIVDPTFAIKKEEWDELASEDMIKEKYLLIYQLNSNKEFDEYAEKVAKANNLKLVRICRRYDQIILNGKSIIIPKVEEFVSLFKNAELIVTDSFHALSFSINLNKQFMCFYPENFSTRLQSCLEMFDLLDRKVDDFNDLNVFDKKIDWNKVEEKLKNERIKIDEYIEKCIKFVRENNQQ